MTDRCEDLLAQLRGYVMTPAEKRAQAISFAVGNVLCMGSAQRDPIAYDERKLRLAAAKAYDGKVDPWPDP